MGGRATEYVEDNNYSILDKADLDFLHGADTPIPLPGSHNIPIMPRSQPLAWMPDFEVVSEEEDDVEQTANSKQSQNEIVIDDGYAYAADDSFCWERDDMLRDKKKNRTLREEIVIDDGYAYVSSQESRKTNRNTKKNFGICVICSSEKASVQSSHPDCRTLHSMCRECADKFIKLHEREYKTHLFTLKLHGACSICERYGVWSDFHGKCFELLSPDCKHVIGFIEIAGDDTSELIPVTDTAVWNGLYMMVRGWRKDRILPTKRNLRECSAVAVSFMYDAFAIDVKCLVPG